LLVLLERVERASLAVDDGATSGEYGVSTVAASAAPFGALAVAVDP
jgi:hypothetical protein